MTLGIAVFILGCMYFYFKEAGFRKVVHIAGKVLGVLVLLTGLGIGVYYLNAWRVTAEQARQEQAEQAKQVQLAAKYASLRDKTPCADTLTLWTGEQLFISAFRAECEGYTTSRVATPDELQANPEWRQYLPKMSPAVKVHRNTVWSTCNSSLTSEYIDQGLTTGHIISGEAVTLLESSGYGAKVKNDKGEVGWVYHPSCISTVKP